MNNIATMQMSTQGLEIMERAWKISEIIAQSDIIPMHYRGKPANVFIAVQSALRMNLDPMLVMQNTFVIGGKLGMNSCFAISLANSSGLFDGGIRYKVVGEGSTLQVSAFATLKANGEEITYTIGMKEAIAENWTKNPKYQSLPELMLRYRAATLLIRTHVPEVINGMHMVDEIEDIAVSKNVVPTKEGAMSKLDNFLEQEKVKPAEDGLHVQLNNLIASHHIPQETIDKWCKAGGVNSLDTLDDAKVKACIAYVESKIN
jgi:hypothetical protein